MCLSSIQKGVRKTTFQMAVGPREHDLHVFVGSDWGSRTSTGSDSCSTSPTAARGLKKSLPGLWNGLEPGPILQGAQEWPPNLQRQASKLDMRGSKSAGNSRRPTEGDCIYGVRIHNSEMKKESVLNEHQRLPWSVHQQCDERPGHASFSRSKSDGKEHHQAAERRTIACAAEVEQRSPAESPRVPREDPVFKQLFSAERGPDTGRSTFSQRSAGAKEEAPVKEPVQASVQEPGWDPHTKQVYQRLYTYARVRENQRKKREEQRERQEVRAPEGRGVCPNTEDGQLQSLSG
jgi:hypothetical protein